VLQCMDSVVVSRRQPVGLHSRASPRPLKDPFGESRRNRWSPYWACRCEQRIAIIVARRQEDRDIDGTGVRQVTADSAWDHRGHPVALIWPFRAAPQIPVRHGRLLHRSFDAGMFSTSIPRACGAKCVRAPNQAVRSRWSNGHVYAALSVK
jgi:hypothetical protein